MIEMKKSTVPSSSVGADEGQPKAINKESISQSTKFVPDFENFPSGESGESRSLPEWIIRMGAFCTWHYEERNGKRTKVPYDPRTGSLAKSNDPTSFCSWDEAASATGYDGIGLGIFNGICAIDLDDCIGDDGALSDLASDIVSVMKSYTEYSPSGKGIHILFTADRLHYDTEKYYVMNRQSGIEVYVSGVTNKYVTVTGHMIRAGEPGDKSSEIIQILDRYMLRKDRKSETVSCQMFGLNGVNGTNPNSDHAPLGLSDDEVAARLSGDPLWNGNWSAYPSHSEGDMALCCKLAFWCSRDIHQMDRLFRSSGMMRDKWDRRQSGTTYGMITLRKAAENCSNVYTPPSESKAFMAPVQEVKEQDLFAPLIPLEQEAAQLPTFPVECLPEPIRNYVVSESINSQTAVDMAAVLGLGVLAICLQGKYVMEAKPGYQEPLSLFNAIIASPGERKSRVYSSMTAPLYEYEKVRSEQMISTIRENQNKRESLERRIEGLDMKLKRKENEEMEKEIVSLKDELRNLPNLQPPRFFADDCTCESLTSLMAENGGVFSVISSEGGIFDILTGRYSPNAKVNIDTWLKGHSGDPIRVDRLGRSTEFVAHPALSAVLTIQPTVLSTIMENSTLDGRGLLARFLYSSPPSRIGTRSFLTPPMPDEVKTAYRNLIFRLMDIPLKETPTVLTLAPDALEEMNRYFLKHEQYLAGEGQDIIEWASKYIGTVLRIAGLLHAAESVDTEVQLDTLKRAIRIGEYYLAHACYAFSLMGVDESIRKAKAVVAKIRSEKKQSIKRCDLFRLCRSKYFKKVEDIIPTLELLETNGYIRQMNPEGPMTPGRKPDVQILINPKLLAA